MRVDEGHGDPIESDDSELADDDPDVVAGMKRLAELRALEQEVRDLPR